MVIIKKIIIILFLILSPCSQLSAQFGQSEELPEQLVIDKVSIAYLLTKDTIALKQLLDNEVLIQGSKNQKSAQIIIDTFLALKTATQLEKLNRTSTRLFEKAFLSTKELKRSDLELWVAMQYGYHLYTYRLYEQSFPYFIYCINKLDQNEDQNIIQPFETYKKCAYFLITIGDYEKAEKFLNKAKTYASAKSIEMASITDGLGLISLKKNDLAAANVLFNEALSSSKASNDKLRYAKTLGNFAEINLRKKNYIKAIALLKEDIAISQKLGNQQNTINALILLGKVYKANHNIKQAFIQLNLARQYAQTESYFNSSAFEINTLILALTKINKNNKEELLARRNLETLKDQLRKTDGEEVILKLVWETEKNTLKLNIESEQAKLEKESDVKATAFIICILLIIIIFFIIKTYQNKINLKKNEYDHKTLNLSLAKANSEQKLNSNHQTIKSYKSHLSEKNSQIKNLKFEMSKFKQSTAPYFESSADKMKILLGSHLMSNELWIDFKNSFIQIYPAYYSFLRQNFEDLTDSNLRIIFLSKLEMDNPEIARILGLSLEAIKKAKQRLKKKYINYDSIFDREKLVEEIVS